MSERSTHHATFVIERVYNATPARVFNAWADPAAKASWFAGPDEWVTIERESDFRVGGSERVRSGPVGGTVHAFNCRYYDIVRDERIVYSYDMHLDAQRISVSLTTASQVGSRVAANSSSRAGACCRICFDSSARSLSTSRTRRCRSRFCREDRRPCHTACHSWVRRSANSADSS